MKRHKVRISFQFIESDESRDENGRLRRNKMELTDLSVDRNSAIVLCQQYPFDSWINWNSLIAANSSGNLKKGIGPFKYILPMCASLSYTDYNDSMFSGGAYSVDTPQQAAIYSETFMSVLGASAPEVIHLVVQLLSAQPDPLSYQITGLVNAINSGNFPRGLERIDLLASTQAETRKASRELDRLAQQFRVIEASNSERDTYFIKYDSDSFVKAFLCHSSQDKDVVEAFANKLLSRKASVWYDKWDIKPGESIVQKVNDGLSEMTHLVIFLSKHSVKSHWVQNELSSGLMRKLSDSSVRIIPIMLDEVEIPTIINHIKYADCVHNRDSGFDELIDILVSD